jgi:hypothetical protein
MTKPSIFKSRKFWIMVWDTVVSLTLSFVVPQFFPEMKDTIVLLVGILQAPVLFVIGAIAYEDAAVIAATGGQPR